MFSSNKVSAVKFVATKMIELSYFLMEMLVFNSCNVIEDLVCIVLTFVRIMLLYQTDSSQSTHLVPMSRWDKPFFSR